MTITRDDRSTWKLFCFFDCSFLLILLRSLRFVESFDEELRKYNIFLAKVTVDLEVSLVPAASWLSLANFNNSADLLRSTIFDSLDSTTIRVEKLF